IGRQRRGSRVLHLLLAEVVAAGSPYEKQSDSARAKTQPAQQAIHPAVPSSGAWTRRVRAPTPPCPVAHGDRPATPGASDPIINPRECCQPGRQWRRSIWRAGRSPDTIAHGAPDGKPSSNIVMLHTPFLVRFGLISTRIGRRARRARTVPVADGAEDEPGS